MRSDAWHRMTRRACNLVYRRVVRSQGAQLRGRAAEGKRKGVTQWSNLAMKFRPAILVGVLVDGRGIAPLECDTWLRTGGDGRFPFISRRHLVCGEASLGILEPVHRNVSRKSAQLLQLPDCRLQLTGLHNRKGGTRQEATSERLLALRPTTQALLTTNYFGKTHQWQSRFAFTGRGKGTRAKSLTVAPRPLQLQLSSLFLVIHDTTISRPPKALRKRRPS